jgi:N-acetylmuramic acid 6-phosphate (MurNAc-6-P) etherase
MDAVRARGGSAASFISHTGLGRIVYLGVGTAGILGLIDASECNPTYGSLFNDVRGFLHGGWDTLANKEGAKPELTSPMQMRRDRYQATGKELREQVRLGIEAFEADFLPTMTPADLVVALYLEEPRCDGTAQPPPAASLRMVADALRRARDAGARVAHVVVCEGGASNSEGAAWEELVKVAPEGVVVALPTLALVAGRSSACPSPSYLGELATKLVCNAITVGAHVRKGTIYRNRMINLMLTNAKLFHRACGIVADVTGVKPDIARRSVLRAIYSFDYPTDANGSEAITKAVAHLEAIVVSEHVHAAASKMNVVPVAIMLALDETRRLAAAVSSGACMTVAEAKSHLATEPVIRKSIEGALKQ